jgi:hypothetical protein
MTSRGKDRWSKHDQEGLKRLEAKLESERRKAAKKDKAEHEREQRSKS